MGKRLFGISFIALVLLIGTGWLGFGGIFSYFSDLEISSGNAFQAGVNDPPSVTVIYPNGGEIWYLGRTYTICWKATDSEGDELLIDIWYSKDSGNNWIYQIADDTENDGRYNWTIPCDPNLVSSNARIKVVAQENSSWRSSGEDVSDEDFCPLNMVTNTGTKKLKLLWDEFNSAANASIKISPPEPIPEFVEKER